MSASNQILLRKACASSVGLALLVGGSALGQDVGGGQRGGVIDEIIVTAQKREESIQDVPVSISVVGDQQLQDLHVTQLTDIAAYVPGFQVTSGGSPGQTSMSLRGLAQVGPGQTVGTYLDDAPLGSSSFYARGSVFQLDLLPYDIERMEVLRGPQGTLYGASTIGGLLKYVTRAPDLSKFEFRAGADVFGVADADDMGVAGRVGFNAPLADGKIAIRGSYAYQKTPGFIDNPVLGIEDQNEYEQDGGRIALLWQLKDNLSLELMGMWQGVDSDNNATEASSLPPSIVPIDGGRANNNVLPEPFKKDVAYYAATLKWDMDWASFVSATSYSDTKTHQVADATQTYGIYFDVLLGIPDGQSAFLLDLELKKWTQEFRLQSKSDGRLEWLVGAFYTHEDSQNHQMVTGQMPDGSPIVELNPLANLSLPTVYREYSVFGDVTFKFTDRFDITAGARWARNDQDFKLINEPSPLLPPGETPGSSSEDVWTYMFSPRFHVNDDTMVYGRVASGYRPGGPNVPIGGADPQVDSDTVVNYELGMKSEFFDRRVYVDVAAFYMDWTDIQVTIERDGVSFLSNAGKADSRGVELAAAVMPIDGLRFGMTAAYTDAKLTADVPPPAPNEPPPGLSGDPLPNIPKWSGSLTVDYSYALGSDWTGRVGAGYRYVDDRFSVFKSDPNVITARSYGALDLSAALSSNRWSLRLFAKNVTDEHADLINVLNTNAFSMPQDVTATVLQPRTIGLALDVTF